MNIPSGALPGDDGRRIQVEIQEVDVDSIAPPPTNITFIRAVELHTLIDGVTTPTDFDEPVEVTFILTSDEFTLVEGYPARVGILWLNADTCAAE